MTPPDCFSTPGQPSRRRLLTAGGVTLVLLAIVASLALGTLGWFVLGFATLTECTNNYSCTTTGCDPCAESAVWISTGGGVQLVLAVVGIAVLVRGLRARRHATLLVGGAALLVVSALTVVGTTWRAQESFCQPGTPGYAASYCSVDG